MNGVSLGQFRGAVLPASPGNATMPANEADKVGVVENTTQLIRSCRAGDMAARDRLLERFLPQLSRWAHGRLPQNARDLAETDDLVQTCFLRVLGRLDDFESEHPGAFFAYLRTSLLNQLREELRRSQVRAGTTSLVVSMPAQQPSLVESMVGAETLAAYEGALLRLPEVKRAAVILRVELDLEYAQIAEELSLPSANAARMMVTRALDQIATWLAE